MEITGRIKQLLPLESGTTKDSKPWKKQSFLLESTEQYSNLYCLELFGEEKVDNFLKYNKVGDTVKVDFNVQTNEWNNKYFTSLQAWKVFKAESNSPQPEPANAMDDSNSLPF